MWDVLYEIYLFQSNLRQIDNCIYHTAIIIQFNINYKDLE